MSVREKRLKDGTTVYIARRFMGYKHDGKPDQRSRTFRTKREAERYDAQLLAENDAMRGRSARLTLEKYVSAYYWPSALTRLAATSLDTYEKELRLRILPYLGNCELRDIDRPKIQCMLDRIETEHVARKCLGVLKAILNEAIADSYITSNPATAKFAMPQKGAKRDNGLVLTTFDQIADLLAIVSEKGSQTVQRLCYTGLLLGLRPEERYALDWSCFDMARRTVSVTSAYVAASKKHGGIQSKTTKTERSTRLLPMHPDFATWLQSQGEGSGAFILGRRGQRVTPSSAQKQWAQFLAANQGAPRVTLENMRHSFATSYLAAGGSVEVLSKMLGHSNIATTVNKYYRPDVDSLRNDLYSML